MKSCIALQNGVKLRAIKKYKVSLRISHPTKSIEELTERLKVQPWLSRNSGRHRTNSDSHSLFGFNTHTFLTCPLEVSDYHCFEDLLEALLDSGPFKDEQYLQELVQKGGRLELAFGVFCARTEAIFLDRLLVEKIVQKQLDISLDVYVERE